MRVFRCVAVAASLLAFAGLPLHAQNTDAPDAGITAGSDASQIVPANRAPDPVQAPDVRLDSAPHATISSALYYPDFPVDIYAALGVPFRPVTPPGMIGRSEPSDPFMIYFALRHRSGDEMSPADRAVLDAHETSLVRAAAYHGYDLRQSGWMFQQGICPAMQPESQRLSGAPAADDGEGALLLHFVRHEDGRVSTFTAIVPRDGDRPVHVASVAHRSVESRHELESEKITGVVANDAIPPATLRVSLEPDRDWLATAACLAEVAGAYPHIPDQVAFAEDPLLAPPPRIELRLDGGRNVTLADRVDQTHYTVWTEHVSATGRVGESSKSDERIVANTPTNPPLPPVQTLGPPAEPHWITMPPPPNPLSNQQQ